MGTRTSSIDTFLPTRLVEINFSVASEVLNEMRCLVEMVVVTIHSNVFREAITKNNRNLALKFKMPYCLQASNIPMYKSIRFSDA